MSFTYPVLSVDIFISKVYPEHVDRTGGTTVMVSHSLLLFLFFLLTTQSKMASEEHERLIMVYRCKVEAFETAAIVTAAAMLSRLPSPPLHY